MIAPRQRERKTPPFLPHTAPRERAGVRARRGKLRSLLNCRHSSVMASSHAMSVDALSFGWIWIAGILLPGAAIAIHRSLTTRVGPATHCRKCDYQIRGIDRSPGTACPECGTKLFATSVRHGQRVRRPWLLTFGLAQLALVFACLTNGVAPAVRAFKWSEHRPTAWVLRDLKSPSKSYSAITEVMRRLEAGELAKSDQRRFTAFLLERIAESSSPDPKVLEALWRQDVRKDLTPTERDRFYSLALTPTLEVRTRIARGEELPILAGFDSFRGAGGGVHTKGTIEAIRIDGVPIDLANLTPSRPRWGRAESHVRLDAKVGRHTIELEMTQIVPDGPPFDSTPSAWSKRYVLNDTFEVVPVDQPTLTLKHDDALTKAVAAGFAFRIGPNHNGSATISFDVNPPCPLAFDLFAWPGEPLRNHDRPARRHLSLHHGVVVAQHHGTAGRHHHPLESRRSPAHRGHH
jgi:hypothetical protein